MQKQQIYPGAKTAPPDRSERALQLPRAWAGYGCITACTGQRVHVYLRYFQLQLHTTAYGSKGMPHSEGYCLHAATIFPNCTANSSLLALSCRLSSRMIRYSSVLTRLQLNGGPVSSIHLFYMPHTCVTTHPNCPSKLKCLAAALVSRRVPSCLQFGSTLQPADLLTPRGYLQNLATWLIKQAAMPVLTGLRPTPWSAVRERLKLPRASSNCPVVDGLSFLAGRHVKRCDVLLNVVMVSEILLNKF